MALAWKVLGSFVPPRRPACSVCVSSVTTFESGWKPYPYNPHVLFGGLSLTVLVDGMNRNLAELFWGQNKCFVIYFLLLLLLLVWNLEMADS